MVAKDTVVTVIEVAMVTVMEIGVDFQGYCVVL